MLPKQTNMLRELYLTENKQALMYVHLERWRVIVVLEKGEGRGTVRVAMQV